MKRGWAHFLSGSWAGNMGVLGARTVQVGGKFCANKSTDKTKKFCAPFKLIVVGVADF